MSKDISVEYAHIYTNQRINDEHKTSLEILGKIKNEIQHNNQTSSLMVMVDDYSFPDPTFDYGTFSTWLSDQGHEPELIIRESQLIPLCDEVLSMVEDSELKEQIKDYIKSKKYPCSLFIAAWYLLRLGKLSSLFFPEELYANKLVNILPESFKPFEDRGLEIIKSTIHKNCVDSIEYSFLPGRMIA